MNLYERYAALSIPGAMYYAQWLRSHDTCPVCCPGREDKRKPGVVCERCGGTGVIETDPGPIPVEPLIRNREAIKAAIARTPTPPGVPKEEP